MRKELLERSKGFTLVELMVVIAIIGILAVVALGIVRGAQQRAKDASLQATGANLSTALETYYTIQGEYPDDIGLLETTVLDQLPTLPSGCGEINSPTPTCGISYTQNSTESFTLTIEYVSDTAGRNASGTEEIQGGTL
ncbi:MAG: type II secretion system protein [Patescibacteria group bacterium]